MTKTPSARQPLGVKALFRRRRLVEHHGQPAEGLLVLFLLLSVIFVEAVAAETRAERDLRRHRGRRHGRTVDRVHGNGARLPACGVHLADNRTAERPQLAAVDLPRLTEADQGYGIDL